MFLGASGGSLFYTDLPSPLFPNAREALARKRSVNSCLAHIVHLSTMYAKACGSSVSSTAIGRLSSSLETLTARAHEYFVDCERMIVSSEVFSKNTNNVVEVNKVLHVLTFCTCDISIPLKWVVAGTNFSVVLSSTRSTRCTRIFCA